MHEEKTSVVVIQTPEGISFPLLLAGPITRFFAWAIDLACIIAATTVLSYLTVLLRIVNPDLGVAAAIVFYFGVSIGYGIFMEWQWRGQTIGKRLLRLRVVDEQGLRLQFSQVVIRNLLRFIDMLPVFYLVGTIACLISRRAQRLGDYAANTIVIRNRPGVEIDIQELASGKYNSFRDHPHLEARLRQHVSPEEASLAMQALLRREELEPSARVELFEDYASHFRSIVTFPEEARFGLTDEQYVRNVVDSLFRVRAEKGVPARETSHSLKT